jgi:phage terminase large subunit
MKEYKLIVTSESLNIIKELNNYTYSDKKSQLVIDDYNHSIDAGRYAISHLLRNPNKVGLRQIN